MILLLESGVVYTALWVSLPLASYLSQCAVSVTYLLDMIAQQFVQLAILLQPTNPSFAYRIFLIIYSAAMIQLVVR